MEPRQINPLEAFLNQEIGEVRSEHQIGFYSEKTHKSAGPRKADCVKIAKKYNIDLGGNPENLGGHEISRMLQDAWVRGKFPKPRDTSNEVMALREQNASMMKRMERLEALLSNPDAIVTTPVPELTSTFTDSVEIGVDGGTPMPMTPIVTDPVESIDPLNEPVDGVWETNLTEEETKEALRTLKTKDKEEKMGWADLRKLAIRLGIPVSGGDRSGLVKRLVLEPSVIEALERA